jgi:large subunit ribosomal protein L22
MQVKAIARNLAVSPRKVKVVADYFKGSRVNEALKHLEKVDSAVARPLAKVIMSAAANAAYVYKIDKENLVIENIIVNQGLALKRFRAVARGTAHGYKKRRSHVTVIVEEK